MFTELINKAQASRPGTNGRRLLPLFVALVFALTVYPAKAHAQIIAGMEANIPFQFYAGNTKLPPGKYFIHIIDNTGLTFMEIRSEDGSTSAAFEVRNAEGNSTPANGKLIFRKYGNRYFLAKLFDEGNPNGSAVSKSRYEKMVSQSATEAQASVPAHHRGQQAD